MVMPSIPGAPLFALTLLYALLKLSLYSIASKSLGCALSLSFHIRLNDLDAFTYCVFILSTTLCILLTTFSSYRTLFLFAFAILAISPTPFNTIVGR